MSCSASIIIVGFNNFDTTTGPCLESLLADPDNVRHEIIVVDNCSTDGSGEKLAAFAALHPQVRPVRNTANRGYAGGNNDGAALARHGIIVLLNSDTLVPPGAMTRLAAIIGQQQQPVMLGPVTNQAGNEQKIHTVSGTVDGVLAEGEKWRDNAGGVLYPSPRLDFFCVAVPVAVYRQLGGLDEGFGCGYYEDTDFSIRAAQEGVSMLMTEDVFVYHRAGASFSSVGGKNVHGLMRENKKRLLRKHPGGVVLHHMRDVNLQVMARYGREKENGAATSELLYRFENRLQLAQRQYPRNIIKKLRYHLRLRHVRRAFFSGADGR